MGWRNSSTALEKIVVDGLPLSISIHTHYSPGTTTDHHTNLHASLNSVLIDAMLLVVAAIFMAQPQAEAPSPSPAAAAGAGGGPAASPRRA